MFCYCGWIPWNHYIHTLYGSQLIKWIYRQILHIHIASMNKAVLLCIFKSCKYIINVMDALSNCCQSQIILTNNVVTKGSGMYVSIISLIWKNKNELQQAINFGKWICISDLTYWHSKGINDYKEWYTCHRK